MVGLLALGLAFGTLAARDSDLLFLMWLHATVPGIVCAWLLLGPKLRSYQTQSVEA
jgi:lipopolysaccharide export system permease protein